MTQISVRCCKILFFMFICDETDKEEDKKSCYAAANGSHKNLSLARPTLWGHDVSKQSQYDNHNDESKQNFSEIFHLC